MPSLHWVLVCSFLLASCDSEMGRSAPFRSTKSTTQTAPLVPTTESLPSVAAPAVEVRNGPNPGSLELRVNGVVKLDSKLIVERQVSDGSFQPVQNLDLGSIKLVTSCDQQMSMCV